jgi:hypothetical protein
MSRLLERVRYWRCVLPEPECNWKRSNVDLGLVTLAMKLAMMDPTDRG